MSSRPEEGSSDPGRVEEPLPTADEHAVAESLTGGNDSAGPPVEKAPGGQTATAGSRPARSRRRPSAPNASSKGARNEGTATSGLPDGHRSYAAIRWIFDGKLPSTAEFYAADLSEQGKPVTGFHVKGKCPACGHFTYSLFPLMSVVAGPANALVTTVSGGGGTERDINGSSAPTLGPGPEPSNLIYGSVHCNCAEYHDGANANFGCGASWLLSADFDPAVYPPPPNPVLRPVAEEDLGRYWPAAEAVRTAVPEALTNFQAKAATWQSGVAAIVTATGLATLTAGRQTIQALESPWNAAVIAAVIVATAASAANVSIALWVNVGFPSVKRSVGARILASTDLAPLRRAARASWWLRWSTACAALAFLAIFFGLVSFIAIPDKVSTETRVSISLYQSRTSIAPTPLERRHQLLDLPQARP